MVRGLDHLVVAVKDLNAAAAAWEDLGFTVTPQAFHPWGTTNRLVQLDGFFVELLSVAEAAKIPPFEGKSFSFGRFNQEFLERREGASMIVLESQDPARDRQDFERLGLRVFDPFSFERTATFQDGTTGKVGFDLTIVGNPAAPGLGFFTCHNRYPDVFWRPEAKIHPNGAKSVDHIIMVDADPSDHHEFLGGFTGQREMRATSLGLELKTPRGTITVLSPVAYRQLTGESAPEALPSIAALAIGCAGLETRHVYPAEKMNGLTLILEPLKAIS
ncbi:glyoxalase-like protein [Roseibium hamelinense]|uniref:Glyoxalase-like protein n=1 Tax=Roseibium hamelinense TaxID=150831 RepID=A0A562TJB8_9HYPH|nr:VOC family protein [Roseibium hamelinense]MTI45721.1 VOC family protein [Roseibium hamelinense]TWI93096.1 glyoxalase-like protein [Roseibium hamelinense]